MLKVNRAHDWAKVRAIHVNTGIDVIIFSQGIGNCSK